MTKRTPALAIVALVAALLLAPTMLNPVGINLLVMICINTLVAVGLSLLFGYAGQISMAQAQFMGVGAYTSAILSTSFGLPFVVTIILSGLIPGVLAYIVGRPILRLKGYYLAMATVAIGGILAVLFEQLKGITGGFNGIVGIPRPSIAGFVFNTATEYYYLTLVVAVLAVLFAWNLTRSRVGRAMRAIRETEVGASSLGVNSTAIKAMLFMLGALLAGVAGSLYAHYTQFISPETFTISQSITFILILAIGGLGSIGGAVIGAALLTLLPQWLRDFGEFDMLLYGLMVIIVIIFLPSGIWGGMQKIWSWGVRRFAKNREQEAPPGSEIRESIEREVQG